jgi:hypothetical protein
MIEVDSPVKKGYLMNRQPNIKDFLGSSRPLANPESQKPESQSQPTKEEIEKTLKKFLGF